MPRLPSWPYQTITNAQILSSIAAFRSDFDVFKDAITASVAANQKALLAAITTLSKELTTMSENLSQQLTDVETKLSGQVDALKTTLTNVAAGVGVLQADLQTLINEMANAGSVTQADIDKLTAVSTGLAEQVTAAQAVEAAVVPPTMP